MKLFPDDMQDDDDDDIDYISSINKVQETKDEDKKDNNLTLQRPKTGLLSTTDDVTKATTVSFSANNT